MQFAISLPETSNLPLYRQISESIKAAILAGRLALNEQLPSSRELAETLNVARVTVARSFEELAAQGYIQMSPGSRARVIWQEDRLATIVGAGKARQAPEAPERAAEKTLEMPQIASEDAAADPGISFKLSSYGERLVQNVPLFETRPELFSELNFSAPALADLPVHRWRDMLFSAARLKEAELMAYESEPMGYPPLREALADYLNRTRMLQCQPEQIAIFTGSEGGSDMLCRLMLEAGQTVAVENPGSPGVRTTFSTHGARLIPISVDDQGIVVDELKKLSPPPRIVYITPSHEDPLGVVLSLDRRRALLDWAHETGTLIVEDDFDSEYYYGERPVPAVWAIDGGRMVVYRYNFWRALYPLVHCGFMVLPPSLVPMFFRAKSLTEREVTFVEQRALTQFIAEGHLDRHVRRTRGVYASRRAALYQALTRYLGKSATILPASAGMHLVVRFAGNLPDLQLQSAAAQAGVPMVSTSSYYMDNPVHGEYMVGFGHHNEEDCAAAVKKFAELLGFSVG